MKITEITTETEISRDDLLAAIAEGEAALDTALEIESPTAEQIAEAAALDKAINDGLARVSEIDAAAASWALLTIARALTAATKETP